jgi:hypothetical protein
MDTQTRRAELLSEYYKLIDILQGYDAHFLSIKTWGVTLSSAALGLAFVQSSAPSFGIAFLLSLAFWLTEARYKLLQLNHTYRVAQLEDALSKGVEMPTPRILGAFGDEAERNALTKRWRSVMFWPQVMLPHIFFILFSVIAGIGALLRP